MKVNKYKIYVLAVVTLAYIVFNVIALAAIPHDGKAYWFSYVFGAILPFLLSIGLIFYTFKNPKYEEITIPGVYYLLFAFDGSFLVMDIIFMAIKEMNLTAAIILNIVLLAAELVAMGYALLSSNYIAEQKAVVDKKVSYIREAVADINYAKSQVSDSHAISQLTELAEAFRYSDPMSDPSLESMENDLKNLVQSLVFFAKSNNLEEIDKLVNTITKELQYRNEKCKNLKK